MDIDREDVREDARQTQTSAEGGTQAGGGPSASDVAAPGGSGSGGGYRHAQNQQNHQGQEAAPAAANPEQSRGERFDEAQGGGRGAGSVTGGVDETGAEENDADLKRDQAEHQDRGQGWIDPSADRH